MWSRKVKVAGLMFEKGKRGQEERGEAASQTAFKEYQRRGPERTAPSASE
jgi:hypothetical protein